MKQIQELVHTHGELARCLILYMLDLIAEKIGTNKSKNTGSVQINRRTDWYKGTFLNIIKYTKAKRTSIKFTEE